MEKVCFSLLPDTLSTHPDTMQLINTTWQAAGKGKKSERRGIEKKKKSRVNRLISDCFDAKEDERRKGELFSLSPFLSSFCLIPENYKHSNTPQP